MAQPKALERSLGALRSRRVRFLMLLSVVGPGIITGTVDNDATGITGYALAGSQFGYDLLWLLIVTAICLAAIQEMVARMGTVTGKGLSDLIRERFGVAPTVWVMVLLFVANAATTVAEFAGIAGASQLLFGDLARYIAIPLAAVFVWFLVLRGSFRLVERLLLILSLVFVSYIVSAVLAHPKWGDVLHHTVVPTFHLTAPFLLIFITIVGTTITPWMAFFQQSNVADKGLHPSELRFERIDTYTGILALNVVAFFIIVATGATVFVHHVHVDPSDPSAFAKIALALKPLAGQYAEQLFAIGLLNASLMAASVLPLSTTYAITEAFGWERGIDKSFAEAPAFLTIYTTMIVLGAAIAMFPGAPLALITNLPNVVNGLMLPLLLPILMLLANDKRVMGRYANTPLFNIFSGIVFIFLSLVTLAFLASFFFPGLFRS
ncbi:MAG TPA: Nramp family divalent metal transporter [Candidatus Dormibacteraeota bacterium]|nr:Nramp family divalent metal transporter [Candidatus Dormibacteraeota bacterium]